MLSLNPDITFQLERLNIDVNTQSLRVEVEKPKRKKLRIQLKRVKKELIPKNKLIKDIYATVDIL